MCPPYTEEFRPAPTHRPVVREKRYINRAVKGQPLAMNHALFLPTSLEMVRNICHDEGQRHHLETDIRLLTGEAETNIPWYVDQLFELYQRMPFSMTDQISEGELHRVIQEMDCGFSPQKASEALWGMDVIVSDMDAPFDQLSWALDWLQKHEYLPDVDPKTVLTSANGGSGILVRGIEQLADQVLINQNGSHHTGRLNKLSQWPGVEHCVLESDEFGPLRCGLITSKGTICYG